ncbi:MAG: HTH-type transcriptional regulator/antitoxin HipB [Psychroserpens sp.]|jgi:HTH-type transcriptional regulator/antitoxin HipB
MTSKETGNTIRTKRKHLKLTQKDVSLATGLGLRFISEAENGKPSCQIDKVLQLISVLGLKITIHE